MDMKNVKNVNFWQVDHKIKNIFERKGMKILPSPEAWQKFGWVRKFFGEKPEEGYFIWVKKPVDIPLEACVSIASLRISQNLTNLLVIEKGVKAKANVICNATKNDLYATHKAKGKVILKEGSFLEYNHFHYWGQKDFVEPNYEFFLQKNSRLIYNYQNLFPPEKLQLTTIIHGGKNSSLNLNIVINGINSKIWVKDTLLLEEKNSQGIVKLRMVGRENSQIFAQSAIFAKAQGKGHLDCQGLLVDKTAKISLIPQLVCQNKEAQITHEASIGKISEEELTYLRMRGLSEKEAIDLIASGFLKI